MRSRAGGAQDGSARPPFHSHDGLKMTLRALLGSLTIAALASAIASAIAACGSPDAELITDIRITESPQELRRLAADLDAFAVRHALPSRVTDTLALAGN